MRAPTGTVPRLPVATWLVAALAATAALFSGTPAQGRATTAPDAWGGPSVFDHGALTLTVSGAVLSEEGQGVFGVWANSPDAAVTVTNHSAGFYHGKLRWQNVPAGSYLESGRRVAEAATATGGDLFASVSLAGGGSRTFQLEPNFHKNVHFAIFQSPRRALGAFDGTARPQFGVELGGLGLAAAPSEVSGLSFPVYLMPGLHDHESLVRKRLGGAYGFLSVGPDRILMLDDRHHRLGPRQFEWLEGQLAAFRQEGVRQVIACFQIAPFDPRLHHRDGIESRYEARRVARLFRRAHIAAIFGGTGDRRYIRKWYGFKEYCLSVREAAIVDSSAGDLSIRLALD